MAHVFAAKQDMPIANDPTGDILIMQMGQHRAGLCSNHIGCEGWSLFLNLYNRSRVILHARTAFEPLTSPVSNVSSTLPLGF